MNIKFHSYRYSKNIKRLILLAVIFIAFGYTGYLASEANTPQDAIKNKTTIDFLNNDNTDDLQNLPKSSAYLNTTYQGNNVTQFDVTEMIESKSTQTDFIPLYGNITHGKDPSWTYDCGYLDLKGVYKNIDLITGGNITTPPPTIRWGSSSSPPYSSVKNWCFKLDATRFGLNTSGIVRNPPQLVNIGDYGTWYQSSSLKPSGMNPVETDFVSENLTNVLFNDEFQSILDIFAHYTKNDGGTCPYGGYTHQCKVVAAQDSDFTIYCQIQAPDSIAFIGKPSVNWVKNGFIFDEHPDLVHLTLVWKKENHFYEVNDKYMMIARINGNRIDGTRDVEGNSYSNATEECLVFDNTPQSCQSHGWISRTWDITRHVNFNNYIHMLDFGIWLSDLDDTDDGVTTWFSNAKITLIHYEQYYVGRMGFTVNFAELTYDPINLSPFGVFCSLHSSADGYIVYLGKLDVIYDSFLTGGGLPIYLSTNLTSSAKNVLSSSDNIRCAITVCAMEKKNINHGFMLTFNDLCTIIQYGTNDIKEADVDYYDGSVWWDVETEIYDIITPSWQNTTELHLRFRITKAEMFDFTIHFTGYFRFNRTISNAAWANYHVDPVSNPGEIKWDLLHNSSDALSIVNKGLVHFKYSSYLFYISGIPAFDNLGKDSNNWKIRDAWGPVQSDGTRKNITSQMMRLPDVSSNLQIVAIISKDLYNQSTGIILNGTYVINVTTPNYLHSIQCLNSSSVPDYEFYDGETLNYLVSKNPLVPSASGNINLTVVDPSGSPSSGFPLYVGNQAGNYSNSWIVVDTGVGFYEIAAFWNDTSLVNPGKTYKIGFAWNKFSVLQTTAAALEDCPDAPVSSGQTAYYNISYTIGGVNLEGATIIVKNNVTDKEWGTEFGTGVYQVDEITVNALGHYVIPVGTEVPFADYILKFEISKPFYDPRVVYANLTVSGNLFIFSFDYGVIEDSGNYSLASNNIPYVNDTYSSHIIINATFGGNPIRDGLISGNFNNTGMRPFIGYELFSKTQLDSDKGRYEIYLNTTGCHETISGNYWYNLSLVFSVDGYQTESYQISCEIMPLPTALDMQPIGSIYEGGSENLIVYFQNVLNPVNPVPISNGEILWSISNGTVIRSGVISHMMAGVYQYNLDLSEGVYVFPGTYNLTITGSALDCSTSTYVVVLEILPKTASNILLTVSPEVRIGKYLDVNVNLTKFGGIPIANAEILIEIKFGTMHTTQVVKTTTQAGGASHSIFVDFRYEGLLAMVNVSYAGNETIAQSWKNQSREILGKYNTTIILHDMPTSVRAGYSLTIKAQLIIPLIEHYTSYKLTVMGIYDDSGVLEFDIVAQINCNASGWIEYTIAEIENNHDNLSISVEYGGTPTESYLLNKTYLTTYPKWNTVMTISGISNETRIGQTLSVNVSVAFEQGECLENLAGMQVVVIITRKEGTIVENFNLYLLDSNSTLLTYKFLEDSGSDATIQISFLGSNKIEEQTIIYSIALLAKLTTKVKILQEQSVQDYAGEFYYSALITDEAGAPLEGKTIYFVVKNTAGTIIANASAVSNNEGIAAVSLKLQDLGEFTVVAYYNSVDYYASSSSDSFGINEVRVVDTLTLIIDNIYMILLALGILVGTLMSINRFYVVPKRNRRLEALKMIHQQLSDVQNIQYLMIIHKERGLPMFSHSFSDVPIEETLISGFLSAISSFGSELGQSVKSEGKEQRKSTGLDELSYQQFRISMYEGEIIRTAVLLLKPASKSLKEKMNAFNQAIEKTFKDELQRWTGKQLNANVAIEVIEKVLKADLLYYHNIVEKRIPEVRKTHGKKSLYFKILNEGVKEYSSKFRIPDMLSHMATLDFKEVNTFNAIADLRDEKVLFAINPRTQMLIDQFKPLISSISSNGKMLLKEIFKGQTDTQKLIKGHKGVDVNAELAFLMESDLITEQMGITATGDIILMLMELIPDL